MTIARIVTATTAAAALVGLVAGPSPAQATAPADDRPATRIADIDGDRRPDRVTLSVASRTATTVRFSLSVRTASGGSSSTRITVPVAPGATFTPTQALQGAARGVSEASPAERDEK